MAVFELRAAEPDTRRFVVTDIRTEQDARAAPGVADPPVGLPGYGLVGTMAVRDGVPGSWVVTYRFGRPQVEREDPRAPFLRAILDQPDDDLPRLVYADWLDERGDAERAEFIRVQCELAKRDSPAGWCDHNPGTPEPVCLPREGRPGRPFPCDYCALRRREQELLDAGPAALPNRKAWRFDVRPEITCEFRRGFVECVTCTAADFARHAAAIFAACPLRDVTLYDFGEDRLDRPAGWPVQELAAGLTVYEARGDVTAKLQYPNGGLVELTRVEFGARRIRRTGIVDDAPTGLSATLSYDEVRPEAKLRLGRHLAVGRPPERRDLMVTISTRPQPAAESPLGIIEARTGTTSANRRNRPAAGHRRGSPFSRR